MIHNDTNVVVVPVLQPKLDSVDFLFSWNAHSFYSNNVPGDRYRTGCKMLGSNIFLCRKGLMNGIWRSWRNIRLIIGKSRTITIKRNLESSSQVVKISQHIRPVKIVRLPASKKGGGPDPQVKLPIPLVEKDLEFLSLLEYSLWVYISIICMYTHILRIPLVNELHFYELWRYGYRRYPPTFRDSFQFNGFKGLVVGCF